MVDKVQLNSSAVRALLRSPEVMAELHRRGDKIAAKAGPEHAVEEWVGKSRARVHVYTVTPHAMAHEAKYHSLLSALDAGRK